MAGVSMTDEDKKLLYARISDLESDRQSWETVWKEIAKYVAPYGGRFTGDQPNDGKKKGQDIYDPLPMQALQVLAAGLMGGLTSPSRPWFQLEMANPAIEMQSGTRMWLDAVEDRLYQAFQRSNFYLTLHQVYQELGAFSTACIYLEEDTRDFIRCQVFTAGQYAIGLDGRGRVDTVVRRVPMRIRQIAQEFGEKSLPDNWRNDLEKNPLNYQTILHVVRPQTDYKYGYLDSTGKPWESIYCEDGGSKTIFRKEGYEEFPYCCPRWDVWGGDVYGRGPGLYALADIKTLQRMRRDRMRATMKMIDPPLLVPEGWAAKINLSPGAKNQVPLDGIPNITPVSNVQPQVAALVADIEDIRNAIAKAFYVDLFRMLEEKEGMTATEVMARQQEKMILLGPVLERLQGELLNPLIERTFGILSRQGYIPDPPREAQGQEMRIRYVSALAAAQKRHGLDAITSTAGFAGQLAQIDPKTINVINFQEALRQFADLVGVPGPVLRDEKEVAAIEQQQMQTAAMQQQALAQQQGIAQAADIASKLGKTDMSGDTALGRLVGDNQEQGSQMATQGAGNGWQQ